MPTLGFRPNSYDTYVRLTCVTAKLPATGNCHPCNKRQHHIDTITCTSYSLQQQCGFEDGPDTAAGSRSPKSLRVGSLVRTPPWETQIGQQGPTSAATNNNYSYIQPPGIPGTAAATAGLRYCVVNCINAALPCCSLVCLLIAGTWCLIRLWYHVAMRECNTYY